MGIDSDPDIISPSILHSWNTSTSVHTPPVNKTPTTLTTTTVITKKVLLVLDTNFILSHLSFVSQLVIILKDQPELQLVIPYVVLQELDGLKSYKGIEPSKKKLADCAKQANHLLYTSLQSKLGCIRGQTLREVVGLQEKAKGDDLILDCCLYFKQFEACTVYLLSNGILSINVVSYVSIDIYI